MIQARAMRKALRRRWSAVSGSVESFAAKAVFREECSEEHLALRRCTPARWRLGRGEEDGVEVDLRGMRVSGLKEWRGAEVGDVDFGFSEWRNVDLTDAVLRACSLEHSSFREDCLLNNAVLERCKLRGASLRGVSLRGACLISCDLRSADFRGADLRAAEFRDCIFDAENALGTPRPLFRAATRFGGRYQASASLADSGGQIAGYIDSERNRERLEASSRFIAFFAHLLTDFGRSGGRVVSWILATWIAFAFLYRGFELPAALAKSRLAELHKFFWPSFSKPPMDIEGRLPIPEALYVSAATLFNASGENVEAAGGAQGLRILLLLESTVGWVLLVGVAVVLFEPLMSLRRGGA